MEPSLRDLLETAWERLATVTDVPRLEAEVLLAAALQRSRSHLHAWPERAPDPVHARRFAALLERRLRGEPVAYILGRREFWSLEIMVTPATLIPRPETELLVALTLERLPPEQPLTIADLGTGSGAIALALARERPRCRVVATDNDAKALGVAQRNGRRLKVHNVVFRHGDWWSALDSGEGFDVIVTNPPYLADSDPHLGQGDLRFEPPAALTAGAEGLDAIRVIIAEAPVHLHPGGWLFLEHGYDQGKRVAALLRLHGFEAVVDHRDAAGLGRVACGRRPLN